MKLDTSSAKGAFREYPKKLLVKFRNLSR
jgi:hypothetical protein